MTLQQQYNLIKEGKGDKNFFMKQALRQFPEFLTVNNTFKQTINILTGKSIISESIGGLVSLEPIKSKDWFKIFEAEIKAENKETEKEIVDMETKDYDYKDTKNIDNLYGQAFLSGYYVEMEDPKNAKKTVEELKAMVAKNLAKDITFYTTNSAFGLKIQGYVDDVPGAGKIVDAKGKYKSSGYGDLGKPINESKYSLLEMMDNPEEEINEEAIEEGPMDQQIAAAEKKVEDIAKQVASAELVLANLKKKEADASAKI
tara:strand:- start:468 stop:1241 length:774 start_codon:yes stop_codon:yes gene_type:complete